MIDHNTKKSIKKKLHLPIYNVKLQGIFVVKNYRSLCTKNTNILIKSSYNNQIK